jgi:hypothetical protein
MKKVILTDGSGRWFDIDSARSFGADFITAPSGEEICRATGISQLREDLYLTGPGTFVLVRTCVRCYNPEAEGAVEIDMNGAARWLISNGHQEEVKKMEMESEERQLEI